EPAVSERVAQLVRVDALDTGLGATALQHLRDAAVGHAPLGPEPQPLLRDLRVTCTQPEVPIESLRCPRAERACALSTTLADDDDDAQVEVDVIGLEVRELGESQPSVDEQPDDRRIASALERARLAGR